LVEFNILDQEKSMQELIDIKVMPGTHIVVAGNLPSADGKYSLHCAVIVKHVDERTRAKTSLNDLLRNTD